MAEPDDFLLERLARFPNLVERREREVALACLRVSPAACLISAFYEEFYRTLDEITAARCSYGSGAPGSLLADEPPPSARRP